MPDGARVRIGHCRPDAPNADIHVDGSPAFENVASGDLGDYAALDAGDRDLGAVDPAEAVVADGDDKPVLTASDEHSSRRRVPS